MLFPRTHHLTNLLVVYCQRYAKSHDHTLANPYFLGLIQSCGHGRTLIDAVHHVPLLSPARPKQYMPNSLRDLRDRL